jgi:8-oxo-dGTP pyrophosphatase MutT (NUDIX family)
MGRVLYRHKWMALREGLHGEAYLDGGSGVFVVPVLDSGRVNLIVETSHVDGSRCIGIPAGTIEAGETPEACAIRELLEETGIVARRIHAIGRVHPMQRYAALNGEVFLAYGDSVGRVARDEPYEIDNLPSSWDEIDEMMRSARLTDTATIACLTLARDWISRNPH